MKIRNLLKTMLVACVICLSFSFGNAVCQAAQYEYEGNDSYATANTLTLGNSVSGVLNNYEDVDCYKMVASSNGKITVDFNHTYEDNSGEWNIKIYRYVNGEYIELSNQNIGMFDNERVSLPYIGAVSKGIYYIKVSHGWNDTTGKNYTIATSFTSSNNYEKEVNNVYGNATNITLGKSYSGNLNNYEDVDCYKIVAPNNGNISLDFKHIYDDNSGEWNIKIYRYVNGEYIELSNQNIGIFDNERVSLPYIGAVSKGIYYIKVSHGWNDTTGKNYTIATSFTSSNNYEKEVNNVYGNATNITIGRTYSGNLNNYEDVDYYKIIAPASGKISVCFMHKFEEESGEWNVRIYRYSNGEYKELSSNDVRLNTKGNVEIPYIGVVPKGVYYIKVSHAWNNTTGKNYSIKTSFNFSSVAKLNYKSSKKKVTLKWTGVSGASCYQIQMKKGKKYKNIKTTKAKKLVVKKLQKNKKYLFRIRYIKLLGGKKYYSVWKNIRVKTRK